MSIILYLIPATYLTALEMSITFYPPFFGAIQFVAEAVEEADSHLLLHMTAAELRQAEVNDWFFLKEELKGPYSNGNFLLSLPLKMELAVRPDLIYRFNGLAREWGGGIELLQALAWEAQQPGGSPDVLLQPDSWLCLGVEQTQPSGSTGFKTLWDKVLPEMEARGIGPKDLDFHNIQVFLNQNQTDEDGNPLNLDIGFGEEGQIFATWPVKDNPRLTPSVPLDLDDPTAVPDLNLYTAVTRFLDNKNIRYSPDLNDSLRFSHQGKSGRWSAEARVDRKQNIITFLSLHPFQANASQREAVQDWVTHQNNQLQLGSFSFDMDTGDLRFRTGASFSTPSGLEDRLQQIWLQNMYTFDKYYREILVLMQGL